MNRKKQHWTISISVTASEKVALEKMGFVHFCLSGWPGTCYIGRVTLKFLSSCVCLPNSRGSRCAPPQPVFCHALYMLGKYSADYIPPWNNLLHLPAVVCRCIMFAFLKVILKCWLIGSGPVNCLSKGISSVLVGCGCHKTLQSPI